MNEITRSGSSYVGYDYKEVLIDPERTSMYVDGYVNFGWVLEEKSSLQAIQVKALWAK